MNKNLISALIATAAAFLVSNASAETASTPHTANPDLDFASKAVVSLQRWLGRTDGVKLENGVVRYPYDIMNPVLVCAPQQDCYIELELGERVKNVELVDSRWQISPSAADTPSRIKVRTNISVDERNITAHAIIKTNVRTYELLLKTSETDLIPRIGFYDPKDTLPVAKTAIKFEPPVQGFTCPPIPGYLDAYVRDMLPIVGGTIAGSILVAEAENQLASLEKWRVLWSGASTETRNKFLASLALRSDVLSKLEAERLTQSLKLSPPISRLRRLKIQRTADDSFCAVPLMPLPTTGIQAAYIALEKETLSKVLGLAIRGLTPYLAISHSEHVYKWEEIKEARTQLLPFPFSLTGAHFPRFNSLVALTLTKSDEYGVQDSAAEDFRYRDRVASVITGEFFYSEFREVLTDELRTIYLERISAKADAELMYKIRVDRAELLAILEAK